MRKELSLPPLGDLTLIQDRKEGQERPQRAEGPSTPSDAENVRAEMAKARKELEKRERERGSASPADADQLPSTNTARRVNVSWVSNQCFQWWRRRCGGVVCTLWLQLLPHRLSPARRGVHQLLAALCRRRRFRSLSRCGLR